MKRILIFLVLIIPFLGCKGYKNNKQAEVAYARTDGTWIPDSVYQNGLSHCYGTLWIGDRLLISNMGGQTLDPLGIAKDGYIMQLKDDRLTEFIPKGILMSPKGMVMMDDHLFIADVNRIVVFELDDYDDIFDKDDDDDDEELYDKDDSPQYILLPPGNEYVSDLAVQGNMLYASVRNTNLVYRFQIRDLDHVDRAEMDVFLSNVEGPNGMALYKDTLYVCSYPQNDSIGKQNAIYMVLDTRAVNRSLYKLESLPGYYCGIVYVPQTRMVYYTDQINGQLRSINMKDGDNKLIFPERILLSPQMLSYGKNKLFVPDVDAGRLYVFTIPRY